MRNKSKEVLISLAKSTVKAKDPKDNIKGREKGEELDLGDEIADGVA